MRKWIYLLIMLFVVGIAVDADAQYKRKKRKKSSRSRTSQNDTEFADRLWYGGNVGLAFSGNVFNISVSPMVGYKFVEPLSMGPRFKFDYYHEKLFSGNQSFNYSVVSWGIGVFSRVKFLEYGVFQIEYEYENRGIPATDSFGNCCIIDPDDQDKILSERENRNNYYIGGGYNSAGGAPWGYEILILYNLNEPSNSDRLPWDIRFGFTYNF